MPCIVYEANYGNPVPWTTGRKRPGDAIRLENNVQDLVDCAQLGVTIVTSTWSVHPDDDDGSVTLAQQTVQGMISSANMSGGEDGKVYRIENRVVTSDSQDVTPTLSVPVLETVAINA